MARAVAWQSGRNVRGKWGKIMAEPSEDCYRKGRGGDLMREEESGVRASG